MKKPILVKEVMIDLEKGDRTEIQIAEMAASEFAKQRQGSMQGFGSTASMVSWPVANFGNGVVYT